MNANINAKKSIAALLAAVMVLCVMATVISEPADAETSGITMPDISEVSDQLETVMSLSNPYMGEASDIDLTQAVAFDGSALYLEDDTVYLIANGAVIDLSGKTLYLGENTTLAFEGNARIIMEGAKIVLGSGANFYCNGVSFFNDEDDVDERTITSGAPLVVMIISDYFVFSSESDIIYNNGSFVFNLKNGVDPDDNELFSFYGCIYEGYLYTETYGFTATDATGALTCTASEIYADAYIDEDGGMYAVREFTFDLNTDEVSVHLHTEKFQYIVYGSFLSAIMGSHSSEDSNAQISFRVNVLEFQLVSDETNLSISANSGDVPLIFSAISYYSEDVDKYLGGIIVNGYNACMKVSANIEGESVSFELDNFRFMFKISEYDDVCDVSLMAEIDNAHLIRVVDSVTYDHTLENIVVNAKSSVARGLPILAIIPLALVDLDGESTIETVSLNYGEASVVFNKVSFDFANPGNATAESYTATGIKVGDEAYDSTVAVTGDKLPVALNGKFTFNTTQIVAGLTTDADDPAFDGICLSIIVNSSKITLGNEAVELPNGTDLVFDKPIVFYGEKTQAVKAGAPLTVSGMGTIETASDAKDVIKGDVIDISGGKVVISDDTLQMIPGNNVVIKCDDIQVSIPKSAMDKMIDGKALCLTVSSSTGTVSDEVLGKLSEADKNKVKGAVVLDVDASTAAVTDKLGNITIVIPVDLQQLGMKKSAVSAYYNNNGNLEKVRATYFEENGQGFVKISTTHFSEYLVCEELELGQKDNTVAHILATLIIVVISLAVLVVLMRKDKAAKI